MHGRFLALCCGALIAGCGGGADHHPVKTAPKVERPAGVAPLPSGRIVPGVALRADRLSDPRYAGAATLFSSVTPENEMKWLSTEPEPGRFAFVGADPIVDFAREHGMRVRGHALVWHGQLPEWVDGSEETMRRHIEGVVGHFRGRVAEWDVVNEALTIHNRVGQSPFVEAQGPGYIARAFVIARAADPKARLAYNETGAESADTPRGQALYRLIRSLVAHQVPIDVVGLQTHVGPNRVPGFERQIRRLAALGVDVEQTEVDVRLPQPARRRDFGAQTIGYRRIVQACVNVPRCRGITVWGLDDGDSWVPKFFPGAGSATLLDAHFRPKPAYAEVRRILQRV